jgi:hypothetical protein
VVSRVFLEVLCDFAPLSTNHALVQWRVEERDCGAWLAFVVQGLEYLFVDGVSVFCFEDRLPAGCRVVRSGHIRTK